MGVSLDLTGLFAAAGKANDPVLDKLDFSGGGLNLIGYWFILVLMIAVFLAITIWRQGRSDKARIPED
jgi:hypothetical protein